MNNSFDLTPWEDRYSHQEFPRKTESGFASSFSQDRARIIHSASFRRLQAKTQVLGLGDSDFYRTRLTHSMEVAQIGSGISESLRNKYKDTPLEQWIPSLHLIEAICLAHDIGHPAFGHGGEIALNYCMQSYGGYEGNGQTLRIVSKLGEFDENYGLDLTRRTILGLIKYPAAYNKVFNTDFITIQENSNLLNLDAYKPPKCIHEEEVKILDWVLKPFDPEDKKLYQSISNCQNKLNEDKTNFSDIKHHKTLYKSFDTSIMELADDIAYGIHDLEDAVALKLITKDIWNDYKIFEKNSKSVHDILKNNLDDTALQILKLSSADELRDLLFKREKNSRKHAISKLVRLLVQNISIQKNNEFRHPLLCYQAQLPENIKNILNALKDFVFQIVVKSPEVQLLEYKGQKIVLELFKVLQANPERLLPKNTLEQFKTSANKNREICDYIAGMTDNYATKMYQKLFMPSSGSIFDKL
ncbi:anti-phage deoxyguanosine triphosphatase [Acinetobacter sichuanensis]|uniref:anti-phage deoxyguanosine triphosphatase n=1 Tax=Acinetobacter sichuanensis TaxID=2136183 RepID=UPI00281013A9|nr:anti-phage deoxyguanosine triphosphatase [Acinetobacter sichuanensis]MDQ9021017.1 anti-phage deoxyguanosine triphosphatase [Acinetobacter sichuanensis]